MEIGLWIGLVVTVAVGGFLIDWLWIRGRKRQRENKELKGLLRERFGTVEEWKALEAQVKELRELKDVLERQIEIQRVELTNAQTQLANAQTQIESAKTQFKDWNAAAATQRQELAVVQSTGAEEVARQIEKMRAERMQGLEVELAAEREKRLRQLTELEASLRQAVAELERRQAEGGEAAAALRTQIAALQTTLDRLASAHAEALRRQALAEGEGGCVRMSEGDRNDVADIRRLCRGMRCENAVLKATFDVYVKPEIERLVREQGVSGVAGIYRIWRKCGEREISYIGQSVDVGERWKTHAKRAWGVDNTGRIVLYQEMMSTGIEEWHWELVEAYRPSANETSTEVGGSGGLAAFLSEREKYWGEFYGVKELGLNKKLG